MTTLATAWMLGCVCWICWKLHRLMAPPKGGYTRRRGSNPPAPGRKPAPPATAPPATPKPDIIPKPQFPSPRKIREDFLP